MKAEEDAALGCRERCVFPSDTALLELEMPAAAGPWRGHPRVKSEMLSRCGCEVCQCFTSTAACNFVESGSVSSPSDHSFK